MALHRFLPLVLMLFVLMPLGASAQTAQTPSTAPSAQAPSTAPSAQAPSSAPSSDQMLKPEELDALVAPIALYPDFLLSLMLMASTYPLEVVTADRWVKANKKLKGDALKSEVDKQAWDESVKSLSASPDVLAMMSSKLDWTTKLGDAVLAQQPDVMDAIQRMRARADANNKLTSTKEQRSHKDAIPGRQAGHRDRADQSRHALRTVLRSRRCLWRLALSRLSALLLWVSRIHRRRDHRDRTCIWRRLGSRALGRRWQLLGRSDQLERQHQQHQYQPSEGESVGRQQLSAPPRAPSRREIQQFERAPAVRQ